MSQVQTREKLVAKRQAATERPVEHPVLDEILPVAMDNVVDGRGLIKVEAMVAYVLKSYPQLDVKEFKKALNMEVARGNLLLVRT